MLSATVSGEAKASWQLAHAALVDLATERAGLDLEEGRSLLEAHRAAVHRQLGYGSFTEYVERLFGYARASLTTSCGWRKRWRGEAKLVRPAHGGAIYRHVLEMPAPRHPTPLNAALGLTLRPRKARVQAGRSRSPREPEHRHHVLRFKVSGEEVSGETIVGCLPRIVRSAELSPPSGEFSCTQ